MTWFRVDDRFADHPKVEEAGNAAVGLWVRCATYSAGYLLDGAVPAAVARKYGTRKEIDRLILARLWVPADCGFVMPDFLDYNPSGEDVKRRRKLDADRKRAAKNGHDPDGDDQ